MSKGEAKDSPRWLTIAMAKAIRGAGLPQQLLDPCESPLDLLVVRSRTYFPDGAYKGIAYSPTPLGEAVFKALSASST